MTISPQLQALLILKDQNYIGVWGLPHYLGFLGGTHHFQLTNGDRVHVDLVIKQVGV